MTSTTFDKLYLELGENLILLGAKNSDEASVRAVYADGQKALTRSLEGISFDITPEMGVPILHSKKMPVKTPLVEIEWIWQEMSNSVDWLNSRNVKIWDEWALKKGNPLGEQFTGTIGKAYGYQLKHEQFHVGEENIPLNQVEYVLHQLKNNPSSRRIMTSLWNVDDLIDMALEPCVWSTHWTVHGGKLNLHVKQRSADFCLGLPFNVYQYHVLHAYVAKFVGIPLGTMHWNIDNLHIYERHIETFNTQYANNILEFVYEKGKRPTKLVIPFGFDYDNFFNNRISEAKLENYNPSTTKYSYEIAI